jgi:hypothetical protein
MNTILRCLLVLLTLSLCGCAELRAGLRSGASGGTVGVSSNAVSHVQTLTYRSTIGFDRDIYPSVDLVFSRLRNGDQDLQRTLKAFLDPSYALLEQKYGLSLSRSEVKTNAQEKTLFFDGAEGEAAEVSSANRTIGLLGLRGQQTRYRLTSWLEHGEARFNSYSPKSVDIEASLKLKVEYFDPAKRRWQAVPFDPADAKRLAQALTNDLKQTYYRYIKTRYDITITSSGGFDEK